MGRLDGKIAVVTGANSGIGLASARRFAEEGAKVFMTGRREDALAKAAQEISGDVTPIQGDVSNLEDLDRLFAVIKDRVGHIDVLFANAGIGATGPIGAISEDSYDAVFGVNVKGTLFTVQKALPLMREGGSIILTGSTTSVTGGFAFSVYSATKAAIRNFARSWALDLAGRGIRVNVLSPGPTSTPGLLDGLAQSGMQDALVAGLIAQTPTGRLGLPEETAAVALFLASDESSFMNGSEVFVDGGHAQAK